MFIFKTYFQLSIATFQIPNLQIGLKKKNVKL